MNTETIIEKFEEQEIAFDLFRGDLMVNATEMAKPFNRRIDFFLKSQATKALIEAMKEDRKSESNYLQMEVVESQILITKEGQHGGTFMCEDLALAFAMWLSPQFHVWVLKTVREIIFGNNPVLVREAVMNMPRIQKELGVKRRKRNRIKAALLGPERRKEMRSLFERRHSLNNCITNSITRQSMAQYKMEAGAFGEMMDKYITERDEIEQQIKVKEVSFDKILIQDDYLDLVKEIRDLEAEQRQFSKIIRYSEFKFSNN